MGVFLNVQLSRTQFPDYTTKLLAKTQTLTWKWEPNSSFSSRCTVLISTHCAVSSFSSSTKANSSRLPNDIASFIMRLSVSQTACFILNSWRIFRTCTIHQYLLTIFLGILLPIPKQRCDATYRIYRWHIPVIYFHIINEVCWNGLSLLQCLSNTPMTEKIFQFSDHLMSFSGDVSPKLISRLLYVPQRSYIYPLHQVTYEPKISIITTVAKC